MSSILEIDNVTRRLAASSPVNDCSMAVQAGSITGLIGPNGSGKTTLFNLITGVYPPDQGEVRLKGQRIRGCAPARSAITDSAARFRSRACSGI